MKTNRLGKEKIKFDKGIISFQDKLLTSLYNIFGNQVEYARINGKNYLCASNGITYQEEIQLLALIPSNLLKIDEQEIEYNYLSDYDKNKILNLLKSKLCFSVQEIYLYNILLDNYIRNNSNTITLGQIHKFYREKSFKKGRVIDLTTIECYMQALKNLSEKYICYKITEYPKEIEIKGYMLDILKMIPRKDNGDAYIEYSLGKIGEILKSSKNYSTIVPSKVFSYRFRTNVEYMIAMKLGAKILEMFGKKKSLFEEYSGESEMTFLVTELLDFPAFHRNGENQNMSLLERVYLYKYKAKVQYMRTLVNRIDKVLYLFKKFGIITYYQFSNSHNYFGVSEFEKMKITISSNNEIWEVKK